MGAARVRAGREGDPLKIGRLQLALAAGVSAVCLWIAFRQVAFADLAASLRVADYRWLLLYPVIGTALNLLRSEIWRLLMRRRVSSADAFWAYGTGNLVNNVLPFRVGEAARIGLLAAQSRLPLVEVATAAALERVLDLVFVIAILVGSLPFATGAVELRRAAALLAITTALGVTALVLLIAHADRVERLLGQMLAVVAPRHGEIVLRRWRELNVGFSVARDPAIAVRAIAGALAVWILTIVLHWTVLRAFQPAAGILEAALLVGIVSLAGAVPAAPGGIGPYQWVAQQALALPFPEMYTPASALAVAVIAHAASYLYGSAMGAIGLWYFGVSFAGLMQIDAHSKPAAPPAADADAPRSV